MYQEHPLIEEIERIQQEGANGCLTLGHDDEVIQIHLRDGLIEAVSSNLTEHRLGQHLVKKGILDLSKLKKVLRKSRRRKSPLGETALSLKILDASQLTQIIHRQAFVLLRRCLSNGLKIHSFEANSPSFNFSVPINPHSLFLELARKASETLEFGPDQLIQLRKQKRISSLPCSPQELNVLAHLNGPQTLEKLVSATGMERSEVKKILEIFYTLGFIEITALPSSEKAAFVKEEALPLQLLIPEIKDSTPNDKLEVLNNESSFISEQFASLKVRIDGTKTNRPTQVIGVSSPHTGDGKSLISSNLALCFARDPGRKVILVDCDLRNPALQEYFGIPLEPGIKDYLTDNRLEPYCYIRRLGPLYLMSAGGFTHNPVELLSDQRMQEMMDYLRQEFDTIVLDSPPLQPIADTSVVFRLVDGILMVIRRAKTPYRAVENAFETLDRSKLLGVVFNDVKPQMLHTYYDYKYYQYGKSSHYPYSANGKKS